VHLKITEVSIPRSVPLFPRKILAKMATFFSQTLLITLAIWSSVHSWKEKAVGCNPMWMEADSEYDTKIRPFTDLINFFIMLVSLSKK
jgi:hypothetical protein